MTHLTADNTNVIAHRFAGDSLVYDCPNCAFGEVLVTALIEDGSARCLDCGSRFELHVEAVDDGADGSKRATATGDVGDAEGGAGTGTGSDAGAEPGTGP